MAASIRFVVSPQGRAALRNIGGDGTNAVLVATVGVTETAFVSGQPLPNEIKRVATIKGGATAPDTIHVTISDIGTDVYSVRGFGLYLDDETLFGSYGQPDVIVEKSAQAAMLIATDIQFADIDATQITFGDTNFDNAAATTELVGVAELATDDETIAGEDAVRVVTPKGLLAALNARLGLGSPTNFVKTLLSKPGLAAFVTALGIRGAAQYDTGAGNGLDADKLDGEDGGYYRAWGNLTDVPGEFRPEAHLHSTNDINAGTFPVLRGGTGAAAFPAGAFLTGNGDGPLAPRTPEQARVDIDAAPSEHQHDIAEVIGLADSLQGRLLRTVVIRETTLHTKGPGTKHWHVRLWSAGGGGGGGLVRPEEWPGGGGSGGGYVQGYFDASDEPVPVTIGKGGPGGSTGRNGRSGGSSSFGKFLSATGGGGGSNGYGAPVDGPGYGIGGDWGMMGCSGSFSYSIDQGSGAGGGTFASQGGMPSAGPGNRGCYPGGGGSGGLQYENGTTYPAGDGADGLCIVEEYA